MDTQNNEKPCLLVAGFGGDTNRKIEEILHKYGTKPIFKGTSGDAIKAIDLNKANINCLLLNVKDLPSSVDEDTDVKSADIMGFVSGATGLIEDALNKETPVIIASNTDNYLTNMVGEVMLARQDAKDNISRAKPEDVVTDEGLKTLLNKSIETTSFSKENWNWRLADSSIAELESKEDSTNKTEDLEAAGHHSNQ